MDNIYIEATEHTPRVVLDSDKNLIEFEGKCYPNNAFEFFEPITKWLKEYLSNLEDDKVTFNMNLSYFNSSTNQILFIIFDLFVEESSNNLIINWYCKEKVTHDYEDYEDFVDEFEDLKFNLVFI